jgi:hypothetical protein
MRRRLVFVAVLLWAGSIGHGAAYETDPYSNRLTPLADAAPALNREMNAAIADIAARWRGPRDDNRFVMAVFHRVGGYYWVDKLERWAMDSPEVEKLPTPRRQSIYRDLPLRSVRVAALFGIGPSFRIGDSLVGSDKIGHFLSQGRKFWQRWKRQDDEAGPARTSARVEGGIFGGITTGSYSNADLVANYEGYRFYRSLFEDGIVPGKPAILRWENDRWIVQRPFDWNDHVNAYWDEALNPNGYSRGLRRAMAQRLHAFCSDYRQQPERYRLTVDEGAALAARYQHLHLRADPGLRLDSLCQDAAERAVAR